MHNVAPARNISTFQVEDVFYSLPDENTSDSAISFRPLPETRAPERRREAGGVTAAAAITAATLKKKKLQITSVLWSYVFIIDNAELWAERGGERFLRLGRADDPPPPPTSLQSI